VARMYFRNSCSSQKR